MSNITRPKVQKYGRAHSVLQLATRSPSGAVLAWARAMVEAYRQMLGKAGEELACRELRRRGHAILARRFRTRLGEIDIVARDGGTIVFVEVKARTGSAWGSGAEAVTLAKQRRLARMAADYLARTRRDGRPCRFDVVAVVMDGGLPRVTWYPNAFVVGG